MNTNEPVSADAFHIENARKREVWVRKRCLRQIYFDFYRRIASRLRSGPGLTVELGSGLGTIREVLPDCITSDLFLNAWLDRRENAYELSFANESVCNLILFDVWHHLQFPGTALCEFERVLRPGGRLILFEPDMGLLGRFVYSIAHHEPVEMHRPVQWFAPPGFRMDEVSNFAAQSYAYRIFVRGESCKMFVLWKTIEIQRLASLSYFLSGGFSKPRLCPDFLYPLLQRIDRVLSRFPSIFAVRLLVVLEKR